MNILITAGGTVERIDAVRSITNNATGRLGSLIADDIAAFGSSYNIFYICAKDAVRPKTKKASIIEITDTASLEAEVKHLFQTRRIDTVIHSMAVSDYRCNAIFVNGEFIVDKTKKINSKDEQIILYLERTPKIISLFKKYNPKTILVGFKLTAGASSEETLEAAAELLKQNNCDFVLANRKEDIDKNQHKAQLIDKYSVIKNFKTKEEIARGITESIIIGSRI